MTSNTLQSKAWSHAIAMLLLSIGLGIAWYAYQATTKVRQALAEEILEQQHDVSTLIQDYDSVMVSLERHRQGPKESSKTALTRALQHAQSQLVAMRSTYSFARLDGAAKAHTYIKPILEDIEEWTSDGIQGNAPDDPIVLTLAANRMQERFSIIRDIASETDAVANELIAEQTDFLGTFRQSLMLLLAAFVMLSVGIAALLIRQRNLQAMLAIEHESIAKKIIEAETRGREQAEEALLGSEQFLRATLNSLNADIAILNPSGTIRAVNAPWKAFVSANNPQFSDGGIGHHYEDVFRSTASSDLERDGVDAAIVKAANVLNDDVSSMFFEYPSHRDENRRWSLISMSTFYTDEGRHAVLLHEDVSERKRLEERDRRLRAELAHVSRLTTAGELASGLAHELNQPLTAITHNCDAVMSSMQSESSYDPELLDTVHDISEQAQRAGGIIRSMRHLVKKDCTDMVPTDINDLVRETVRLTAPEAREKGVNVTLLLAEHLPKPTLDPIQIQQVLVNLERNSVEAMWLHNSTVRELSIETLLSGPDYIEVCISDTGPGVDPAFSRNLFTAFQTTKDEGMGLGLSISRTIVEEHGGRLWIDPNTEGVTMFRFTIPYTQG